MFDIIFYEDINGHSELYEELKELSNKSTENKDARIQFKQITYYIELLKKQGSNLPNNIIKHIIDDIWELRPGNNRILYFYWKDNYFVLLHMFRKKTQKTPKSQIDKAKKEYTDFKNRNGR